MSTPATFFHFFMLLHAVGCQTYGTCIEILFYDFTFAFETLQSKLDYLVLAIYTKFPACSVHLKIA